MNAHAFRGPEKGAESGLQSRRPSAKAVRNQPQSATSRTLAFSAVPSAINLQRKCGCGGDSAMAEDEMSGRATVQPSLAISTPGDPYELEADRVADQVMRMPDPSFSGLRIRRLDARPLVNRTCASCAARDAERGDLSSVVTRGTSGGGQSLDEGTRSFMESRFGRDFGHVRVHTGGGAAESARSIKALAYTVGSDIVFGAGRYSPHLDSGRRLIAHELAHTVQQGGTATYRQAAFQRGIRQAAGEELATQRQDQGVATTSLGPIATATIQRQGPPGPPPPPPPPPPAAPSPTDFQIRGKTDSPGDKHNIFFERNSAVVDGDELKKIPDIITDFGVATNITLNSSQSEDETPANLATQRADAVDHELATAKVAPPDSHPAHTGTRAKPAPIATAGIVEYRGVRKVEVATTPVGVAAAPSTVPPSCATAVWPCPAPASPGGKKFTDAQTKAETIVKKASDALAPAALAAAGSTTPDLMRDLFGGTDPDPAVRKAAGLAEAPGVRTKLNDLKLHIHAMTTHRACHGTCDDPGCGGGRAGYNTGLGGSAVMTLCPTFFNPSSTLDDNTELLTHEGSHGTTVLNTEDLAYRNERRFPFLPTADAKKNTDSYVVLVRLIDVPGSVAIGPPAALKDIVGGGATVPEERAVREAAAHLDKWLLLADFDTQILYDTINRSLPPAAAWASNPGDAFNRETMQKIAPLFGLTDPGAAAPFVQPTSDDRKKVASIHDRFVQMRLAVFVRQLTFNKIAAGSDSWAVGPGTPGSGPGSVVSLTAASIGLALIDRVKKLVELVAVATPDVSAFLAPKYRDAADEIHKHRAVPP